MIQSVVCSAARVCFAQALMEEQVDITAQIVV